MYVINPKKTPKTQPQKLITKKKKTFTGGILVAINPFQPLNIYGKKHVKHYSKNASTPHIFSIAETAYKNMKNYHKDQSILIWLLYTKIETKKFFNFFFLLL